MRRIRGFTLWELILTISVMSVLAAIAWPVYSGVKQAGDDRLMVSRALALEAAMVVFAERNPLAADMWQTWNDEEKYQQMIQRGYLRDRGLSWSQYQGEYTLVWPPSPSGRIGILDAQLKPVVYE
jgi:prepilin-type N-terminal cleavage/methylation domain-containing protein